MAAIGRITVEGFKSIGSLQDLKLRQMNILIGANGSGKSSFLAALRTMRMCVLGGTYEYVQRQGGADRILHFGSKVTSRIGFRIKFRNDPTEYSLRMVPDSADHLNPGFTIPVSKETAEFHRQHLASGSGDTLTQFLRDRLENWRKYHFHDTSATAPIKRTADLHDNRYFRKDGSNIAPFLYRIRHRHEDTYDIIRRTVRLAAPFLEDFALKPLALNEDKIRLEWRHVGSDAYFDASSLSDGSLRFIALATALLQPLTLRPSVILLDEPELGLHPYAIGLLASLLRRASADSQVIVATQSPTLLDHFEPEEVLVADRVEGATQMRRLARAELEAWLDDYSLGQLWEKNELGGRPAPEDVG